MSGDEQVTEGDRAALRVEVDAIVDDVLQDPLASAAGDEEQLRAFGDRMRAFASDLLVEGFERGFAAAVWLADDERSAGLFAKWGRDFAALLVTEGFERGFLVALQRARRNGGDDR